MNRRVLKFRIKDKFTKFSDIRPETALVMQLITFMESDIYKKVLTINNSLRYTEYKSTLNRFLVSKLSESYVLQQLVGPKMKDYMLKDRIQELKQDLKMLRILYNTYIDDIEQLKDMIMEIIS
jgi:hypothetical protein